jgi:hypothetical protein
MKGNEYRKEIVVKHEASTKCGLEKFKIPKSFGLDWQTYVELLKYTGLNPAYFFVNLLTELMGMRDFRKHYLGFDAVKVCSWLRMRNKTSAKRSTAR